MALSKSRKWVWRSSRQTVETGQLSLLACFETLLGIVLFAIIWSSSGLLILGAGVILATPLFLLKSSKSEATQVLYTERFRGSKASKAIDYVSNFFAGTLALIATLICIMISGGSILSMPEQYEEFQPFAWFLLPFIGFFAAWWLVGSVILLLSSFLYFMFPKNHWVRNMDTVGPKKFYWPLLSFVSVWFSQTVISITASLRHLPSGLVSLPGNWRRLVLCEDSFYFADAVYEKRLQRSVIGQGLESIHLIASDDGIALHAPGTNMKILRRAIYDLVHGIFVVIHIALRLTLKSTAPIFFPFVFVSTPGELASATSLEAEIQRKTNWRRTRVILAFFNVFFVCSIILPWPRIFETLYQAQANDLDMPLWAAAVVELTSGTDSIAGIVAYFSDKHWLTTSFLSSLLTILLFYLYSEVRANRLADPNYSIKGGWRRLLPHVVRARDLLSSASVLLGAYAALRFAYFAKF